MTAPKPIAFAQVRLLPVAPLPVERAQRPQSQRDSCMRPMARSRSSSRNPRLPDPELDLRQCAVPTIAEPGVVEASRLPPQVGPDASTEALMPAARTASPVDSPEGQVTAATMHATCHKSPVGAIARSVSRATALRELWDLVIGMCGNDDQRQAGPWEATVPLQRQGLGASQLYLRLAQDSLLLVFACDSPQAREVLAPRLGELQRQLISRLLPPLDVVIELEMR